MSVVVTDDVPEVGGLPVSGESITEGTSTGGTWTSDEGADGATTVVTVGVVDKTLVSGGLVSFTTTEGTLTVFAQDHATLAGTWTFVSNDNLDNTPADPSRSFTATLTDADNDGDTDTHTHTIPAAAAPVWRTNAFCSRPTPAGSSTAVPRGVRVSQYW